MGRLPPLLIVQGRLREVMQAVRRTGRASTKTSIGDEIAHLRDLDLKGLRARWQGGFQRSAPANLPRHLLFAILADRIQADRFGDLDYETRQLLDRTEATESETATSARLVSFDQKRTELTAGTVLVREWDRKAHRVMVMANGFAWNGQTFDSLSKVAFAITGTKWNGPRFFGLRAKEAQSARSGKMPAETAYFRWITVSEVREDWVVVDTRIEPVTPSMSMRRSPPILNLQRSK
jgi:hypothetical protein